MTNIDKNKVLNNLKFNLKAIEIKNSIYNLDCDKNTSKLIDEYLFSINSSGDYYFNFETRISDELIFKSLKETLSNLDTTKNFKQIETEINNNLKK